MTSSGQGPTVRTWQNKVFRDFRLYAVTDLKIVTAGFFDRISAMYSNGVDIVQLRSKTLSASEMVRIGLKIKKIALFRRKLFFVNDSVDLAILTGADGIHVGQDDISPRDVRQLCRRLKKTLFLGLSSHSTKQARAACLEPVDYFAVGPVFQTPTKPHYGPVGLELVKRVRSFATKPWVAIGGIDLDNLVDVMGAGAERVAVVRALFEAKNAARSARIFSMRLKGEMK